MTIGPSQAFAIGHPGSAESPVRRRPVRAGRRCRTGVALVATATLLGALSECGDDDDDASPTETSAVSAGTGVVPTDSAVVPTDTGRGFRPGRHVVDPGERLSDGEEVAAAAVATLEFGADGTTLTGSTGCNQFSGTYTQSGSDLTIALGPVTLGRCTDPAATAQEAAILAHLPEVASFSADEQLVLRDSSDATLLTYDAG